MSQIKFINENQIEQYKPSHAFIANISTELDGKRALLQELKKKLFLPDYFGYNWDALEECLRDFNWIKQKIIVLIHTDFPKLNQTDSKIYLEILINASNDWTEKEEHLFEVVFPIKVQKKI